MEENKNVKIDNNVDKETLRAMKIDVDDRDVLHVVPVAHNKGLEIQPATSVDENLPTFDVPVEGIDIGNTEMLAQMGLDLEKIRKLQNNVNTRMTNRALTVRGERKSKQSEGPSIGE